MSKVRKKTVLIPPIEELEGKLKEIYYLVGKHPLHKLVLQTEENSFSPGFNWDGTFYVEEESKRGKVFFSVLCGVRYDFPNRKWVCYLTIADSDDMDITKICYFTLENWQELVIMFENISYNMSLDFLLKE